MGERTERVVAAVRRLFEDLSVDLREERVVRYIVDELRTGRDFDAVMSDPYVVNHTREGDRARILERPQVLHSIEDVILSEFHDYQRMTSGAPDSRA